METSSEPKGKEPATGQAQEANSPTTLIGDAPAQTAAEAQVVTTVEGILPADYWIRLAQNDEDDIDSALEENLSSTASITSSILEYRTIHGRTYHSDRGNAQYWGANDKIQMESMDIAHHAFTLILNGKLHLAPLEEAKLQKVLDVGTGTGIWAIDFAHDHPDTVVIGTDVSPIQSAWVPPNVRFEIEDCTEPWTFEPESFDYIHMRFLLGSIDNWEALMRRAFNACKPGGIIESFEPSAYLESDDGSVTDNMAMGQWGKLFAEVGRKFGRSFEVYQRGTVRAALEGAGFVDIHEENYKIPIGGWAKNPHLKEIGRFTQLGFLQDPEGYLLFLANAMRWEREEILVFLAHLRRELGSPKVHAYYRQKLLWARKPVV